MTRWQRRITQALLGLIVGVLFIVVQQRWFAETLWETGTAPAGVPGRLLFWAGTALVIGSLGLVGWTLRSPPEDVPADPLESLIWKAMHASTDATKASKAWLESRLSQVGTTPISPSQADAAFASLFKSITDISMRIGSPNTGALVVQLIRSIEHELEHDQWTVIPKSGFYFFGGKHHVSLGQIAQAQSFFLRSDHCLQKENPGTPAGALYAQARYQDLVENFLAIGIVRSQLGRLSAAPKAQLVRIWRFMSGAATSDKRSRILSAYWHIYFLTDGSVRYPHDMLDALIDLGFASEAVARAFTGMSDKMLGTMLGAGLAAARHNAATTIGYDIRAFPPSDRFEADDPSGGPDATRVVTAAISGSKAHAAVVVNRTRNQASHSGEPAAWYLDEGFLWSCCKIHLEFQLDLLERMYP